MKKGLVKRNREAFLFYVAVVCILLLLITFFFIFYFYFYFFLDARLFVHRASPPFIKSGLRGGWIWRR